MREIESEVIRGDQRACLANLLPQHLSQRSLEEVGGGVVASDVESALKIDPRHNFLTNANCSFFYPAKMHHQLVGLSYGAGNYNLALWPFDLAGVAYLPPHLTIEGGFRQNYPDLLPLRGGLHLLPSHQEHCDLRRMTQLVVTHKANRRVAHCDC